MYHSVQLFNCHSLGVERPWDAAAAAIGGYMHMIWFMVLAFNHSEMFLLWRSL